MGEVEKIKEAKNQKLKEILGWGKLQEIENIVLAHTPFVSECFLVHLTALKSPAVVVCDLIKNLHSIFYFTYLFIPLPTWRLS